MTTTPSPEQLLAMEAKTGHSERFRKVSNGYPRAVALAYDRSADWRAIGTDEGRDPARFDETDRERLDRERAGQGFPPMLAAGIGPNCASKEDQP